MNRSTGVLLGVLVALSVGALAAGALGGWTVGLSVAGVGLVAMARTWRADGPIRIPGDRPVDVPDALLDTPEASRPPAPPVEVPEPTSGAFLGAPLGVVEADGRVRIAAPRGMSLPARSVVDIGQVADANPVPLALTLLDRQGRAMARVGGVTIHGAEAGSGRVAVALVIDEWGAIKGAARCESGDPLALEIHDNPSVPVGRKTPPAP